MADHHVIPCGVEGLDAWAGVAGAKLCTLPSLPARASLAERYAHHAQQLLAYVRGLLQAQPRHPVLLQLVVPAEGEGMLWRGLGGLLPGSRKAQLWELFQELYSQLSAEAADDFHQLFGKAFLAAYEGYIAQLREGDE